MIIKIIGHDRKIFSEPLPDNPWSLFFKTLSAKGHTINTCLNDQKFDVLVMNSYLHENRVGMTKVNKKNIKKFLILWEPKQVNPKLYKKSHIAKYDYIYSPSKLWINAANVHLFKWPQGGFDTKLEIESNWNERKNKVILISGNKFSVIQGELYSLRRKVIEICSQENILDLGGIGWTQNKLRNTFSVIKSLIKSEFKNLSLGGLSNPNPSLFNYLGPISDKQSMQTRYKISLVIENSSDYVSEKLFDALSCQNIVVYVGPELQHFGLNDQMVIRVAPKINSIFSELKNILHLNEEEQFKILERQQLEYKKIVGDWNNRAVLEKLAKDILEKIPSKPIE
jgi:hypothetical protein